MTIRKLILLLFFSLFALSASSQNQEYTADSLRAQRLINDKITQLETLGISEYLYMFSVGSSLLILYKKGQRINGIRNLSYYKPGSRFRNVRLTKQQKSNYTKCIDKARMDTTINFSGCHDDVHAFSRIVFSANSSKHSLNGSFTTDCWEKLERNDLYPLDDIYKRLLTKY
ncbi:hypothetical protein QFZ48_004323 [Chitinophaga sp. W2I13]